MSIFNFNKEKITTKSELVETIPSKTETATYAAGCFWGVEDKFRATNGVLATRVGYIGGQTDNPTYKQVCYSNTGHAEAVEVVFDPTVISFEQLTELFFSLHNPCSGNRQGFDIGSQYRSAIFTHSERQESIAKAAVVKTAAQLGKKVTTEVSPAQTFWEAEDYHQQFNEKNGRSCRV